MGACVRRGRRRAGRRDVAGAVVPVALAPIVAWIAVTLLVPTSVWRVQ